MKAETTSLKQEDKGYHVTEVSALSLTAGLKAYITSAATEGPQHKGPVVYVFTSLEMARGFQVDNYTPGESRILQVDLRGLDLIPDLEYGEGSWMVEDDIPCDRLKVIEGGRK